MSKSPDTFRQILAGFGAGHAPHDVFRAFVRLVACAMAAGTRETEYLSEAARWKASDLSRFAEALGALVVEMEANPFTDLLGPVHMDTLGQSGQKHGGEYHTPQPIVELMAQCTIGDVDENASDPITLCEPACGSGAMILGFASAIPRGAIRRLRVTAVDVNVTACDMCFVNSTLWGIPTTVIHGNSLSGETWAQWRNVHMALPWLWRFIPTQEKMPPTVTASHVGAVEAEPIADPSQAAALAALAPHQGQPPLPEEITQLREQLGQLDLFAAMEDPAA